MKSVSLKTKLKDLELENSRLKIMNQNIMVSLYDSMQKLELSRVVCKNNKEGFCNFYNSGESSCCGILSGGCKAYIKEEIKKEFKGSNDLSPDFGETKKEAMKRLGVTNDWDVFYNPKDYTYYRTKNYNNEI